MPPPGFLSRKQHRILNFGGNVTGETFRTGATTPPSNTNSNRPGNATTSSKLRAPANSSRKRPAEGDLQNDHIKSIQLSAGASPHGSPSTKNNAVGRPMDARKVIGPVIDLRNNSPPSSPANSLDGKEVIDLTGVDEPINLPTPQLIEVIDLTIEDDFVEMENSVNNPISSANSSPATGHHPSTSFRGKSSAFGRAQGIGGPQSASGGSSPSTPRSWVLASFLSEKESSSQQSLSPSVRRPRDGHHAPIPNNGQATQEEISQTPVQARPPQAAITPRPIQITAQALSQLAIEGPSSQGTHANSVTSAGPVNAATSTHYFRTAASNRDQAFVFETPPRVAPGPSPRGSNETSLVSSGSIALESPQQEAATQGHVAFAFEASGEDIEEAGGYRDEPVDVSVGQLTIAADGSNLPQPAAISNTNVVSGADDIEEGGLGDASQQSEASSRISSPAATSASASANPAAESDSSLVVQQGNGRPRARCNASDDEYTLESDDDNIPKEEIFTQPRTPKRKPPSVTTPPPAPYRRRTKERLMRMATLRVQAEDLRAVLQRPRQRPEIPMGDRCFYFRMPLEVRLLVYRYLLRAREPIRVMHVWSQLCRGQKLHLHPVILRVSKGILQDAARVLYGENEFRYLVRDQATITTFPGAWNRGNARIIDVENYTSHFRQLELRMERNRSGSEYDGVLARAVDTLSGYGANLNRLTIHISHQIDEEDDDDNTDEDAEPICLGEWFDPAGPLNAALKASKTSFIRIHLCLPDTGFGMQTLHCTIDKRSEVNELEVFQLGDRPEPDDGSGALSLGDRRRLIESEQAARVNRQLDQLRLRIETACSDPEHAIEMGWFEIFG